ncbi:alpha carbonic anhydrase 7-like [Chenopodium quinoa]|uniref:Carbonic anhydrase n=1 Tax=Chenopodium quinoa TaxID=63459 RepID=A0A803NEB2_CHEQI|nr:alpha carbonic anhydrase 7-like [Chenopodium quinoa]XP_021775735.1 alpha carbonic anhydrase 7-like [Chenopodium quinoa]
MKYPSMLISSLIFSLLILLVIESTIAQEVDDETEFDYIRGSERGPDKWGHIKEEWATCKTGKLQSPIDLLHRRVQVLPRSEEIVKFYRAGNATVKNRGHDIMIEWEDGHSTIEMNGTTYILRQCHWHSPSEHTINGIRFAAELHLVHQSLDNKIAVIGLLYKLGKPNLFLTKLMKKLELVPHALDKTNAGEINPGEIKFRGNKYYRYMGSLTTPPCTEGVIWTVDKRVATISEHQVAMMREVVHDDAEKNARPVHPKNGRKIRLYTTTIKSHNGDN